jgi:uncharacterized protein (TIGR00106 family)
MIIAEVSIFPVSEGTSLSRYVKAAYEVIRDSGLKHQLTAMGTIIEAGCLEELFNVVAKAEKAVLEMGARRVVINLKVDHRVDKEASMEGKVRSVLGE